MYNKDRKYLYYEDKFGVTVCYIDKNQPMSEDVLSVTIIAEKYYDSKNQLGLWDTSQKDTQIYIRLKNVKNWKFYENYEEFFELFWEAVL